jgi:predicted dehydrogenase
MRAMPAFQRAREWVQAGKIGEPVLVNARKSYRWGVRPEWYGDREMYGGTWPWVGIHAVDMSAFITGLSPVSVSAQQANRAHPDRPGCEDSCSGLFQLDNGGSLTASVDILRPETAPTHGDDYCRVVGTNGIIEANASAGNLRLLQNGAESVEQACSRVQQPIYGPFLESLGDPAADREETALGFMLTDAVLQAREAADTKKILPLNPKQWSV